MDLVGFPFFKWAGEEGSDSHLAKEQLRENTARRPDINRRSVLRSPKYKLRGAIVPRAYVWYIRFTFNLMCQKKKVVCYI